MTYALFAKSKNVNFLQMMNAKKVFSVKGYKRIQVNLAKAKMTSLLNQKNFVHQKQSLWPQIILIIFLVFLI